MNEKKFSSFWPMTTFSCLRVLCFANNIRQMKAPNWLQQHILYQIFHAEKFQFFDGNAIIDK